jgi:TonB-dependent receptor
MLRGHVSDQTNSVLPGARVKIDPNGQTAVTDTNGDFAIYGLPAGQYTVTISYLGFNSFTQQVNVTAETPVIVTAALQVQNAKQEVTVYAGRESGQVEALNRQMTADNILQVLPSEVIESLPNTNIADAVGRMPSVSLERDEGEGKYVQIRGTEPRLSNVTIDGIHLPSPENIRNVKLDVIPADLVESIEVSKTLSANQDADAIGGSVNLVTRSATDQPYLSAMSLFGFTPIDGGRNSDQFTLTGGQRFGKRKQFGVMLGASFDYNGRGINDIEPVPSTSGFVTEDLRDYLYDRKRFGFGGTLDYKIGDMSSVYLRGIFARFRDYGEDYIYSPNINTFTGSDSGTGNTSFSTVSRRPVQLLFSAQQGMRLEKGPNLFIYNVALSQAGQKGGFNRADFSYVDPNPDALPWTYTIHDLTPIFASSSPAAFDPTQYALSGLSFQNRHTFERDVVGDASYARRYSTNSGSWFGTFEVGMKVNDSIKNELDNDLGYNFNGTATIADFQSSFTDPHYYNDHASYPPATQFSKILSLFNSSPGQFASYDMSSSNIPADFNVGERIYAGYLINTLNIHHFRIQTGVRIEATDDDVLGYSYDILSSTSAAQRSSNSYVNVLPSVQVSYNFNGSTDIRFGYGMGIARPNFGDLAPYRVVDLTTTPYQIQLGTPGLKATNAQNFDAVIEKYLKPVGILQFGGFYKSLSDPIYQTSNLQTISGVNYLVTQQVNGPSGHIGGIEASWEQQLRFLPGALTGMGIRANYSYTTSSVTFPANFLGGRTDHPLLNRDAPNNWNFDVTYDRYGLSARMGLTHNDANIWAYNYSVGADGGLKGPNGDLYLYPHTQVDAEVNYVIPHGKGFRLVASFLNLNNEVFGFYYGSERYPIQREYYHPTYSFGLRWVMPVAR